MTGKQHKAVWTAGIFLAVFLVLAIVYAFVDPGSSVFFPKCPMKLLTGYQCPSCGVQRATHALMNGHFLEALHFNWWFVLAVPFFLLIVFSTLFPGRPFWARIGAVVKSKTAIWCYIASYFLWWVLRNLLGV